MCTESPVWGNTTRLCSGGGERERSWTNVNARSFSTPSSVMDYHLNSDYLSNIVLHIRILIYQISNIRYGFSASIHKRQAKQLGRYGHEAWRHQSVGTSDTVFVWLDQPQPQLTGHLWPTLWMTRPTWLYCGMGAEFLFYCFHSISFSYKNGSITRERIQDVSLADLK